MAARFQPYLARGDATKTWTLTVLCIVLVLAVYARVRTADFIWDDDAHVYANPTIVGPLGLKEIWTSGKANYFPLTMTSFWAQHALWGLAPAAYHVVTVCFHAAAGLMLWRVLKRLAVPGAWLGAMAWALHPVQVESVAWISELKNTQSGFFYLLAIFLFVRWGQTTAPLAFNRDYALALLAAVLAILSKSSTVMLPVVLGLVGWWQGRRGWRDVRWLIPFLAVSLIASGWTIWEQKVNSMASGPEWNHGLASRLMIAGKVPWFYLWKLVWPLPLIFIYPRWDVNALGLAHWLPFAAILVAGFVLWRTRRGAGQPVFVAGAYFLVSLFPVLGLFDVFFFRYSFVGDHFQYLASMGPLVLAGVGVTRMVDRLEGATGAARGAASALLLGVLGLLTWRQTGVYENREKLWADTVRLNPRAWIAQVNLGAELMTTGRPALAIPHYEAALQLRPDDPLTQANWGAALIQLKKPAEAIPHLEAAVRVKPDLANAHDSLGVALASVGRLDAAIEEGKAAVQLTPESEGAWINLGNALAQAHRLEDALPVLDEQLRKKPDSAVLQSMLGRVLVLLGRLDEAIEHYRIAVRLAPHGFFARCGLAELLVQKKAFAEAVEHGEAALREQPDSVEAQFIVGNAFMLAGRPAEAVPHYDAVVRHQPSSAAANNNYASALLQTGRIADAVEYFRRALQLQPGFLDARFNLALALGLLGRTDEAIAHYNEILRVNPEHKAALEQLKHLRGITPVETPKK